MTEEIVGLIPAAGKGLRLKLPYPKELYPIIRKKSLQASLSICGWKAWLPQAFPILFLLLMKQAPIDRVFWGWESLWLQYQLRCARATRGWKPICLPGLAHALNSAYHLTKGKTICLAWQTTIMTPKTSSNKCLGQATRRTMLFWAFLPPINPINSAWLDLKMMPVIEIIDKPAKTDLLYCWGFIVWRPNFTEYLNHSFRRYGGFLQRSWIMLFKMDFTSVHSPLKTVLTRI